MQRRSKERISLIIGWLIVAVPAAVILLIAAWGTSARFGVSSGLIYAAALGLWAGILFWHSRRG